VQRATDWGTLPPSEREKQHAGWIGKYQTIKHLAFSQAAPGAARSNIGPHPVRVVQFLPELSGLSPILGMNLKDYNSQ
jgi:hypothetical protein